MAPLPWKRWPSVTRSEDRPSTEQARTWSRSLDGGDPGWRDVVHTIKGAARGVGANALGDACAVAEAGSPADLPAVKAALVVAVAEIEAYQAQHA